MIDLNKTYRVFDANLNRAREGLRVVEEITRFVLEDTALSKRLKDLRHELTQVAVSCLSTFQLLAGRQSQEDIGRKSWHKREGQRENYLSLVEANMSRAQEASRVLEEFSKLLNPQTSLKFKEIRFNLYDLEKEVRQAMGELEALPDS